MRNDTTSRAARASFLAAAIPSFQRALTLAPNDETFLIALGRVYDSLGRYPEAEWTFGRAVAWDPRSDVVRKSYAAHLKFWKGLGSKEVPQPHLDLPDKNAPIDKAAATPLPQKSSL